MEHSPDDAPDATNAPAQLDATATGEAVASVITTPPDGPTVAEEVLTSSRPADHGDADPLSSTGLSFITAPPAPRTAPIAPVALPVRTEAAPVVIEDSDQAMRHAARATLVPWYAALRAMSLYPRQHTAVREALKESWDALSAFLSAEGKFTLIVARDTAVVNGLRITRELESYASLPALLHTFQRTGIGQLSVDDSITQEMWASAIELLVRTEQIAGSDEERFLKLTDHFVGLQISAIALMPAADVKEREKREEDLKTGAQRAYSSSISAFKKVVSEARLGRSAGRRELKRAVQSLVDQILEGEAALLSMTALREYDDLTYVHSVNVAVFALALGRRLGLDRKQLYDLALCGIFHDLGKSRIPLDILRATDKLTPAQWEEMKTHPWQGALLLANMWTPESLPLLAVEAAYEHHMKVDCTGYPAIVRPRTPTIFSKIIAVVDSFDAATTKRSYQNTPLEPGSVLQQMLNEPRWGLDPIVVKALISTLGIYPVGTLVLLDSYELGIVQQTNPIPEHLTRPIVLLIADSAGHLFAEPMTADLAERLPDSDAFVRTIISIIDPVTANINVNDFLP